MIDRFMSTLGLARRAGKLSWGSDTVSSAVNAGKAVVVFMGADLSDRSKRTIDEVCKKRGVPCIQTPYSMDQLGDAVGVFTGILALTDSGLAKSAQLNFELSTQPTTEKKDIPLKSKEDSK